MSFLTDYQQFYLNYLGLTKPEMKEKVFYKTNILPQDTGEYRVSVTKFQDGNTDAVMDVVKSIAEAKQFILEHTRAKD